MHLENFKKLVYFENKFAYLFWISKN